jgi:hypothetical protein
MASLLPKNVPDSWRDAVPRSTSHHPTLYATTMRRPPRVRSSRQRDDLRGAIGMRAIRMRAVIAVAFVISLWTGAGWAQV